MKPLVLFAAVCVLVSIFSCSDDECPTCPFAEPDLIAEITSGWWFLPGPRPPGYTRFDSDTVYFTGGDEYGYMYCLQRPYELVKPDTVRMWTCRDTEPDSCWVYWEFVAEIAYLATGEPRLLAHQTTSNGDRCYVYVKADPPDSLLTHCGFD